MEPEPIPTDPYPLIMQASTPTGQSPLAYRLAATFLLINVTLGATASLAAVPAATPSLLVIESAVAIGLIDLRRGARTLALIRAFLGVIAGVVLAGPSLLRADQPIAAVAEGALSQLAYATSIVLLLLGKSRPWRIASSIAIFVFGLASAQVWQPYLGSTAGQTVNGTSAVTNTLLTFSIAELVAATAIKQIAQKSSLLRLSMYVLAIISIITAVWVAALIGIAEDVEAFVVAILWPVAAVIVFVQNRERKRFLLYGLAVLGVLFWIVQLFSLFTSGGR